MAEEYGYCDDYDDYDEADYDPEMAIVKYCPWQSYGLPQLGTDDCEFTCPLRKGCVALYENMPSCVSNLKTTDPSCYFFHMGACYFESSLFKRLLTRLKCRLGRLPKDPRSRFYEETAEVAEITEGHGRADVSCCHGSRWIWWRDKIVMPKGAWNQVVLAPDCDCSDPPRPVKEDNKL